MVFPLTTFSSEDLRCVFAFQEKTIIEKCFEKNEGNIHGSSVYSLCLNYPLCPLKPINLLCALCDLTFKKILCASPPCLRVSVVQKRIPTTYHRRKQQNV